VGRQRLGEQPIDRRVPTARACTAVSTVPVAIAMSSISTSKIADVGPGAYVGELSLLDKGERSATVTADTPMTLLVLSPREFASLLDQVPSMAIKLLRVLAGRVRELDKQAYG